MTKKCHNYHDHDFPWFSLIFLDFGFLGVGVPWLLCGSSLSVPRHFKTIQIKIPMTEFNKRLRIPIFWIPIGSYRPRLGSKSLGSLGFKGWGVYGAQASRPVYFIGTKKTNQKVFAAYLWRIGKALVHQRAPKNTHIAFGISKPAPVSRASKSFNVHHVGHFLVHTSYPCVV